MPGSPETRRFTLSFWLSHVVFPLATLAAVILFFERSDLDLRLSDLAFDFASNTWPHQNEWFFRVLLHTAAKWFVVIVASVSFLAWAASFKAERLRPWRKPLLYLVVSIALSTGAVGLLKATTNRYCPREMTRYGGQVPYTKLFEGTPAPFVHGRGWPAGHASAALSLCALYFVFRERSKTRVAALTWLAPAIVLGAIFGYAQHVRGAHFVSHNFWSAAICWLIALGLYVAIGGLTPATSAGKPTAAHPSDG